MAINSSIILAGVNHYIDVLHTEINDTIETKNYTNKNSAFLISITAKIDILLKARFKVLFGSGNPLTGISTIDNVLKPLIRDALTAYLHSHEADRIGTNKDNINRDITAQIAEFR